MKLLIKCSGFVGDHLFTSDLAKELKEVHTKTFDFGIKEVSVDYSVEMHQVLGLFNNNPHIDNVYIHSECPSDSEYDLVIQLPGVDQSVPPPLYFRNACGIDNGKTGYKIYTNKGFDDSARLQLPQNGKVNIAVQANWEEKSFLFTEEQYKAGINHVEDATGYGGARRDTHKIIKGLKEHCNIISVGFPSGTPNQAHQPMGGLVSAGLYSMTASIIKACDWMVGAESGLINLAAGVGTKTIITGDFVHQLYGWNGVLKKIDNPKLGPEFYFPNSGHVSLDPYLSDEEVIEQMRKLIWVSE